MLKGFYYIPMHNFKCVLFVNYDMVETKNLVDSNKIFIDTRHQKLLLVLGIFALILSHLLNRFLFLISPKT